MNLKKFAQRVALLEEVIYNINSGNELRDDQVSVIAEGESTKLPADFHKMSLWEKSDWVANVMREYIKQHIDDLFSDQYALAGAIHFGHIVLTTTKVEVETIDPQDQENK